MPEENISYLFKRRPGDMLERRKLHNEFTHIILNLLKYSDACVFHGILGVTRLTSFCAIRICSLLCLVAVAQIRR